MLFMLQHGYRVIAHARRGHGRSAQPAMGNDMDTYADDLAAVVNGLDLKDAIMVGHSTGGVRSRITSAVTGPRAWPRRCWLVRCRRSWFRQTSGRAGLTSR